MQLVDAAHERQIGLADRFKQLVRSAPAYLEKFGLLRNRQFVISVDHGFALSNPALPIRKKGPHSPLSARSKKSFQRELPDLGVQRLQVYRPGWISATEDVSCAFEQLPLAFGNCQVPTVHKLV